MNEPQRLGDTELEELNVITSQIIGCAIEVHRTLGPGLLEAMYETALCIELENAGIPYVRQIEGARLLQGPFARRVPCGSCRCGRGVSRSEMC